MSTFLPFGAGTYTLNSSISSTATTITLTSFTEPVSGTPYTMVLIGSDIAYGTISPRTTSSEFISFTGITQNADGTATLTGVTRGLAKKSPFTGSSTFRLPHSGQSVFIISDPPQLFNKYVTLENAETISGIKTFTTASARPKLSVDLDTLVNEEFVDFGQLSRTSFAGTVDATLTVKGIVEIATTAEIDAGTATGGTGASIVARPDQLALSIYNTRLPTAGEKAGLPGDNTDIAVGSGNKYVTQTGFQKGAEVYAATATGNDTYVITLSPVPTSLVNGMILRFKADVANTGPATLNVNSLGALAIVTGLSTALITGDILANQVCIVVYNSTGTVWELVNPASAYLFTPTYANGIITRAFATASGAVTTAHGLGRIPKFVTMNAVFGDGKNAGQSASSNGSYNGTTNAVSYLGIETGGPAVVAGSNTTDIVYIRWGSGSADIQEAVATVDATNITLTWTKTGSTTTGNIYITWLAGA